MLELAEDELKRFFKVWTLVFASLSYCYIMGKITPRGLTRLIAILPIIALFLALPLKLTSFHFCGLTAFFIAWLANFKLLLFAFGKGPLCYNPSISFPHFLALSCLPIKIQHDPDPKKPTKSSNDPNPDKISRDQSYPHHENSENHQKSAWNYIIKSALLALIIKMYDYSDYFHQKIKWLMFYFHMYFILELVLAFLGASAKLLLGFELEPQFNEPLLSTSLQDFWGRRWNIMVTKIMRPMIYLPLLEYFTRVLERRMWAQLVAVMSTFLVSAIMHEIVIYYLGRVIPTLEVTWFFLLHGFSLCVEVGLKKSLCRNWRVPWWIASPITVVFVSGTGMWLFLPPLVRAGLDIKPFQEYAAVSKLVRTIMKDVITSSN